MLKNGWINIRLNLKKKEAIAEPSKEVKHRIASLKRKIARAEKALGNVTVTNE